MSSETKATEADEHLKTLAETVRVKKRKLEEAQTEYDLAVREFEEHPTTKRQRKEESEKGIRDARDRQVTEWWRIVSSYVDAEAHLWLCDAKKTLQGPIEFESSYSDIAFGMGSMDISASFSCDIPVSKDEDEDEDEKNDDKSDTKDDNKQSSDDEEDEDDVETEEWTIKVERKPLSVSGFSVSLRNEDTEEEYDLDKETLNDARSKKLSWNQLLEKCPDTECHWPFFLVRFSRFIPEWLGECDEA